MAVATGYYGYAQFGQGVTKRIGVFCVGAGYATADDVVESFPYTVQGFKDAEVSVSTRNKGVTITHN